MRTAKVIGAILLWFSALLGVPSLLQQDHPLRYQVATMRVELNNVQGEVRLIKTQISDIIVTGVYESPSPTHRPSGVPNTPTIDALVTATPGSVCWQRAIVNTENASKLNVRSSPGGSIISQLNFGEVVLYRVGSERTASSFEYVEIDHPTTNTAWVAKQFLSSIDGAITCGNF